MSIYNQYFGNAGCEKSFVLLNLDLYVLEDDASISNRSFMRSNHLRGLVHVRIKGGVGILKHG